MYRQGARLRHEVGVRILERPGGALHGVTGQGFAPLGSSPSLGPNGSLLGATASSLGAVPLLPGQAPASSRCLVVYHTVGHTSGRSSDPGKMACRGPSRRSRPAPSPMGRTGQLRAVAGWMPPTRPPDQHPPILCEVWNHKGNAGWKAARREKWLVSFIVHVCHK